MKKSAKNNNIFAKSNYNEEAKKIVKILIVVVIVLAIVYLGTALATGELKLGDNKATDETETTIQYEEIIAGEVLNRSQDEYYVLLLNYTDDNSTSLISLKDNYESVDEASKIYLVDLDKAFNNSIIAESEEIYTNKPAIIGDLKVNGTTILKVKNGKVTKRVEGYDKVSEYIKGLSA